MSDLSKTIEIIFAGVDNLSDVAESIDKKLSSVGTNMQDIGAPFVSAAEKVAALETAILGISAAVVSARGDLEAESAKMTNALGKTTEEAQRFEQIAINAYNTGFAGELTEAFNTTTFAAQKFGDVSDEELSGIIGYANSLNYTFGTDIKHSMTTAKALMDSYGYSGKQAYDFINKGIQDGLDSSGDFLDSIKEYIPQFKGGGASAEYMYSVLKSGFQEGIAGADAAGDSFKEFNDKVLSFSATTKGALESLGIDSKQLHNNLSDGTTTTAEAYNTVISAIKKADDQSVAFSAGAELMGEPFIKMGLDAVKAIDTTNTALDDMAGKIESIEPNDLTVKFNSAMNTIKSTVLSDEIWGSITSGLGDTFDEIKENFVKAWENLSDDDFGQLLESFESVKDSIIGLFADADIDLTSAEGITEVIQELFETVGSINTVFAGMTDAFSPVVSAISTIIQAFNDLDSEIQSMLGQIVGFGSMFATGGALMSGLGAFIGLLSGPAGVVAAVGVAGSAIAGLIEYFSSQNTADIDAQTAALKAENKTVEELINQLNELPTEMWTEIEVAIDNKDYVAAQELIDKAVEEQHLIEVKAQADFEELNKEWLALGKPVEVDVDTKKATEELEYFIDGKRYTIEVPVNTGGIDDAKKKAEEIPTEKQIEIKLQGEIDTQIAQIEASAKTADAAFKYTAEVNVAEIQAAAKVASSAFDAVGSSVSSVATSVSDMFGSLVSGLANPDIGTSAKWHLEDMVEEQQDKQNELIDSQIKLNEAQIKIMELKTEALEKGESLITIDSSGLEPALEMIMWEIIQKVQVKANEEAADFLLGIGA